MCQSTIYASGGTAGNKQHFKVLNHYKTHVAVNDGQTQVFYYKTPVVSYDASAIVLNTGGWQTNSTKVRMNQASQEFGLGFRVFQKQGAWFIAYRNDEQPFAGERVTFDRTFADAEAGRKEVA